MNNIVVEAARAMKWLPDFINEDDPEITAGELWSIALGYAYLISQKRNPNNSGWLDWLIIGGGLTEITIGKA